jgi:hypothetical protein
VGNELEAAEQYDVVVLGFEPRAESPVARLQRGFGIDADSAAQLVMSLPHAVQHGVSRVRAEYFRRALTLLGAQVEVRDANWQLIAPELTDGAMEPAHTEHDRTPDAVATQQAPWQVLDARGPIEPAPAHALNAVAAATHAITAKPPGFITTNENTFSEVAPFVRGPAHPTAHEQRGRDPRHAGPELAPSPAAPTQPPSPALHADFHPPPRAAVPNALPARPRSIPAAAQAIAPAELPWPRVPSSVWDPPDGPPSAPRSRAVGKVAAAYQEPLAAARPVSAPRAAPKRAQEPPLEAAAARNEPPAARAAPVRVDPPALDTTPQNFDLTKSIARNGVWRAPAPAEAAPTSGFAGISFEADAGPESLQLYSGWEQPSTDSIMEPAARPSARAPIGQHAHAVHAAPEPGASSKPPAAGAAPSSERSPAKKPINYGRPAAVQSTPAAVQSTPAAVQSTPAAAAKVAMRARPERADASQLDTRSFWETFGEALALPFSGHGLYWIGVVTLWSLLVGLLDMLSGFAFVLGWIIMFCAHSSLLALACDFYRICLWQPMTGETTIDQAPELDPARILDRYVKGGAHLTLFMIASQIPAIWYVVHGIKGGDGLLDVVTDPVTWLLALLPYFYWPMGVGLAALNNDFAAIWNVPTGFRAILRAPLEYVAIGATGAFAFVVSWIALLIGGSLVGISASVLSATVGFPLAISHGLQGALMGHLARSKAEIFD